MSDVLRVRAPATSANLGPGFDAFGVALTLYLEAAVEPRSGEEPRVTVSGEGAGELPDDETNLVWRAFVTGCERLGVDVPDVALTVRSDIPLERGLGSSAAAIVAGLGIARALANAPISDLDLVALAADLEGHPDNVAPAILGGLTCVARRADGSPVVRRTTPAARLRPLLLVPAGRLGTVEARAVLPEQLERGAAADQAARAGHVLGALAGLWPVDPDLSGDHLHEPARTGVLPVAGRLLERLRASGVHAWLSGAGPACCAAVARRDRAAHDTVEALAADHDHAVAALHWDLAGLLRLDRRFGAGAATIGSGTAEG